MLDPKLLRESPEVVRAAIAKKHLDADVDAVLALDGAWRALLAEVEQLRSTQKAANTAMAARPKGSPEFIAKVQEMKAVSAAVKEREVRLKELEERWHQAMLTLPNLPHESVPTGRTPEENVVFARHGDSDSPRPLAVPHWEIAGFERLFDFGRGAKVTGAGFPFFIGEGARLVRALLNFFLEENGKAGYVEVSPPIFVNAASATATGQLPDKEGQMYETADKLYAVPTAEVPLTNFYRDEILEESLLPVYRCAYTPCFRREAGSYGKDVRGLNRVHQFDKVELLKWVRPETSYAELEALRGDAERLLQKLELPYRVLLMCGGDLGFAQAKKYDLEVWAAGQKRWLEVSSCSNFEAFQARRAQIRFRAKATGRPELVHTLNGS
ncbi:MAG: serine--tRNA ligase, partial [Opitutales bacterium]